MPQNRTMLKGLTVLATILTTATGCSRMDLALRWADTFVMHSVTDYFELTSAQKDHAREEFNKALKEVRREDFAKLAAHLRSVADLSEKNQLHKENIETALKELRVGFLTAGRRFEPMAQKVVTDQVASDFKYFDQEFQKKYAKDLKRAQDPAQARSKLKGRSEDMIDESIEFLTSEQKEWIKDWQTQITPPEIQQIESRKFVFEKFKLVREFEPTRTAFVHQFFTNWESLQSAPYLAAREEYQRKILELTVRIGTTLNEKQRKNLSENFRKRADEFAKLAKD